MVLLFRKTYFVYHFVVLSERGVPQGCIGLPSAHLHAPTHILQPLSTYTLLSSIQAEKDKSKIPRKTYE